MQAGLFIGELFILYFLSRWLTTSLFTLFLLLFRSRPVAITIILLLQFPGTVIHELAHLFTAEILRVPTGKLTLVPESIREENIRSGSVAIAQTDPFRRYAIGLAPLFAGMLVLAATSYFLPQTMDWLYILLLYLLFAVSNTMFSSPEDVKGFWPFAVTLAIFLTTGYMLGLRFSLPYDTTVIINRIIERLIDSLGVVLIINSVLLCFAILLRRIFRIIAGR